MFHRFEAALAVEEHRRHAAILTQGQESSLALRDHIWVLALLIEGSSVGLLTFDVGGLVVEAWADVLVAHVLVDELLGPCVEGHGRVVEGSLNCTMFFLDSLLIFGAKHFQIFLSNTVHSKIQGAFCQQWHYKAGEYEHGPDGDEAVGTGAPPCDHDTGATEHWGDKQVGDDENERSFFNLWQGLGFLALAEEFVGDEQHAGEAHDIAHDT